MLRAPLVFLLLALLVAWATPPAPALGSRPGQEPERQSLEELLERLRREREERLAELRGVVHDLAAELDRVAAQPSSRAEARLRQRIVALGPDATPLLVAWIDPGPSASEAAVRRARIVTEALLEMDCGAVERELFERLSQGTLEGRLNAAQLLGAWRDPEHVAPRLLETFRTVQGPVQRAVLRALLKLGGPTRRELIDQVLRGPDAEHTDLVLEALAEAREREFAPDVAALLEDPERSLRHAAGIIAYYDACPEDAGRDVVRALLALLPRNPPHAVQLDLLQALPGFEPRLSSELRRALEPLRQGPDDELREAALAALARLGDRRAQRELLAPYDEAIDQNPRWAVRWVARAQIWYRIENFGEAIDDYKKALLVAKDDPRPPQGAHVGLARCYARLGKLKDAASWLESAPISTRELRALAQDPVFAELRANEKYGRVFRLGD